MKNVCALAAILTLLMTGTALAVLPAGGVGQSVTVDAALPQCVPAGGQATVATDLPADADWESARVYFRAADREGYYFVEMNAGDDGRLWGIAPKAAPGTEALELYVQARDARGRTFRSAPATVGVDAGCRSNLDPDRIAFADNLVVGETLPTQQGRIVEGFLCDGVLSRFHADGTLALDDTCRALRLAAAMGAMAGDEEATGDDDGKAGEETEGEASDDEDDDDKGAAVVAGSSSGSGLSTAAIVGITAGALAATIVVVNEINNDEGSPSR